MKILKKILFALLILILVIILAVIGIFAWGCYRNEHYWLYTENGGELETKYTAWGEYDVSYAEYNSDDVSIGRFEIWYPAELESSDADWPVIVYVNGTGVPASSNTTWLEHLASWGFIVIGNEDENTRTGASTSATLDFILEMNEDAESALYGKVDTQNIGIAGHSQGGVGAAKAVTNYENGSLYKAIYLGSATSSFWGQADQLGTDWGYDVSLITIPCFMTAGTGIWDAGTAEDADSTEGQGICPLWSLLENYNAISDEVTKVIARKKDVDHGDSLNELDAYIIAWFRYFLQGDEEAGAVFFGEHPELLSNPLYQDVLINE